MNRKGTFPKTPLLILSALVLMGVLLVPGDSKSFQMGGNGGEWQVNGRTQNLNVTCPADSTCVEWCIAEGAGPVEPTGAFCCVDDNRIPYDRHTDCSAANGGWRY